MVVLLEFAIGETVIRRFDQESFKDALYLITPPSLRETGLPFEENILHVKRYVLAFWNFFFVNEKLSSLLYTGQFLDTLTVTSHTGNYSVTTTETKQARVGEKRSSLEAIPVGRKIFRSS
jgi:hypothetical protein